ncbi:MAG: 2-amino-4-hydroxy-6-hydroxymethyldihydropteridine diphosphokinase [Rhodospirillales bacterium]|nr:2-amino-4-hydroxy-6-hydroxymethyldihydropteridine diphosphokinase [Rhodospirillales bacterium]
MILIGIGANLPSPRHGPPRATCGAALEALNEADLTITARSRWYKSAPVPVSDQPWFVNGVAQVKTALDPVRLMALLLRTEEALGRKRNEPNAPRVLDLDLLAFGDMVLSPEDGGSGALALEIPHPRLFERAFVLLPLRDVAPGWRHPVLDLSVGEMIADLSGDQQTDPMNDAGGVFGTEWRDKNAPDRPDGEIKAS